MPVSGHFVLPDDQAEAPLTPEDFGFDPAASPFTPKEIAFRLRVSEDSIEREISEGLIRAVRIRSVLRVPFVELGPYLMRSQIRARGEPEWN